MLARRITHLLIVMGVFNLVDYGLTLRCLNQGFHEANPIMRPLVDTPWFFTVKVVLVPLGLYWVWHHRQHVKQVGGFCIWAVTTIYTLLMLYYAFLFLSGTAS